MRAKLLALASCMAGEFIAPTARWWRILRSAPIPVGQLARAGHGVMHRCKHALDFLIPPFLLGQTPGKESLPLEFKYLEVGGGAFSPVLESVGAFIGVVSSGRGGTIEVPPVHDKQDIPPLFDKAEHLHVHSLCTV